ncbi:MAG: hypothetical protein V4596_13065 [Bdellovibrionota bacterium]
MKLLIINILLSFFVVNSFAQTHANEIGMLRGTVLAQRLAQAKTYADLNRIFVLSKNDRKLFYEDLKKYKLLDKPLPKFSYEKSTLTFQGPSKKIALSFKDVASNKIYFNGYAIGMKEPLSYIQSLILVRDIYARKNKSALYNSRYNSLYNLIFPNAEAAEAKDGSTLEYLWAALVSSESVKISGAAKISFLFLEERLIDAYEKTISNKADGGLLLGDGNFDHAEKFGDASHAVALNKFTCSGNRLSKLTYGPVIENGFRVEGEVDPWAFIKFNPKSGYTGEYTYTTKSSEAVKCSFEAGLDGTIKTKSMESVCAKKGENIFKIVSSHKNLLDHAFDHAYEVITTSSGRLYGDFPKVADACCQKKGCEAKVNAAVDRALNQYTKRVYSPKPKSKATR